MWSKDHAACVRCGGTDRKHLGKGLCAKCYLSDYRSANAKRISDQKKHWYDTNVAGTERSKMAREERYFSGMREPVLSRDRFRCTECGSTSSLVVHHKDGNGRGCDQPNNCLDNLVTLCRSCHAKAHRIPGSQRKYSDAQIEQVRTMHTEGMSGAEISRRTGISKPYVHQVIKGQYR